MKKQIEAMFENIANKKGGIFLMVVDDETDEIVRFESEETSTVDEMFEIAEKHL